MYVAELRHLLKTILARGSGNFSGIGLIVTNDPASLPITGLRPDSQCQSSANLLDQLIALSHAASDFHDGFHILSSRFDLLRVSQYFSPPIVTIAPIDPSRHVGGRFMAAIFGSALPGAIMTGVASPRYGVAVFEDGREVTTTND